MQDSAKDKPASAESKDTQSCLTFRKRLRTTSYIVGVHFSTTAKENVNDKILRLIKNDIARKHSQ